MPGLFYVLPAGSVVDEIAIMEIYQMPAIKRTNKKQLPAKGILHAMGEFIFHQGQIYSAKEWLDFLGLSVHFTITPSGVICQHLPMDMMGAHAKGHNTNTVGIELLVAGVWTNEPFKKRIETAYCYGEQYTSAVEIGRWMHEKQMTIQRHSDIDERVENGFKVKVDPGSGFPFSTYLSDITS
jgi:N-acetyl-anhydromuramyl-L-alanine amidase AmpD